MLYNLIEHALSTNDSVRYIRTLLQNYLAMIVTLQAATIWSKKGLDSQGSSQW